MQFNFQDNRSDLDVLHDKIYAAMETGNTGAARIVVAEHQDSFPSEIAIIISQVQTDYGIRL